MTQPTADHDIAAIEKTVHLDADVQRVWRAISDPAELACWFPDHVDGWRLEPGHTGTFVWDDVEGSRVTAEVRVEKVDPPTYLSWTWGDDATDEPVTLVEWTLSARDGGGTTLLVRESGFKREEHRAGNVEGWDHETSQLAAYVDRG